MNKKIQRLLLAIMRETAGFWPDKLYLSIIYYLRIGKKLNLKNPQKFTEKLQWLKLYDHNDIYTKIVDKYLVKDYVANIIGDQYIIPTLGVWQKTDDIDFDSLPNQFVLKCNHDSGGLFICKDKKQLSSEKIIEVKKKLDIALNRNFYIYGREWPYKNVKPRVFAEKYMVDESGTELKDYKIFCFNGEPKVIQLDFNRFNEHKKNLYSPDWELLPFNFNYPSHPEIKFEKPQKLDEMLEIASKLSKGKTFLRVDLYWTGKEIYFGELTFFPASGMGIFEPEEWDYKFGSWLDLSFVK